MYKPESLRHTHIQVESKSSIITLSTKIPNTYSIQIGNKDTINLSEDDIEAIYYAMHKLKTVRYYNNEPQEFGND